MRSTKISKSIDFLIRSVPSSEVWKKVKVQMLIEEYGLQIANLFPENLY